MTWKWPLLLFQNVNENTRFRIDHVPLLIDLLFTNEESMVDIEMSAPLEVSDNVCITWTFYCSADVNTNQEGTEKRAWNKQT